MIQALSDGMKEDSEFENLPASTADEDAFQLPHIVSRTPDLSQQAVPAQETGSGQKSNEMTGLVLLINTALGGLGTLYATTNSTGITLAAALLTLLLTVVVLVVKRVVATRDNPQGEDRRGGK
ncbi:hypothetical protein ACWCQP_46900 [Streptomyces chartreusis]